MIKTNLLLLLSICYFQFLTAQKLPSTLLWKISGNGLQKPSYLYGTMHLTDERIFNIGDSVYTAIKKTDGFATEIDPEQFTPFVIDIAKKSAMRSIRIKDMMQKDEFKKFGKALAKRIGKNEDEITTADILHAKNKWIDESYSNGKMQTFLDVYLLDIARRQGKWTGGVEDLQDQENLVDLIDESDIQELIMDEDDKTSSKENSLGREMIKDYIDNNLDAIYRISYSGDSSYTDALLVKRNKKMATRMDSLSRERSMVFAVGAAHLPGEKGVIQLLKEKGFTVEPVFSSKKIKPADYKVAEIDMPWYSVEDDADRYTALMPGKAGNLTLFAILNMKMYFDAFKSTLYMTCAFQAPYSQSMVDSIYNNMTNYYFNVKDYSKGKPITINNVPGREFFSTTTNYSKGYLLFKDGVMYMAIAMSMKKDTSAARNINKFLHSFTIHEIVNNNANDFDYVNRSKAYKVTVPAQSRSANELIQSKQDSTLQSDLNISTDPLTGAYYFFGTNETVKGYSIMNDSLTLANIEKSQESKFNQVTTDTMYFKNGYRVMELGGMMAQAPLMLQSRYIFRGNRWYALVAMYDSSKGNQAAEKFFNSFQMLDYANEDWNDQTPKDKLFSTWAPGNFMYSENYSNSVDTIFQYICYDSLRANNYEVVVQNFGKYYWQNSDSSLWNSIIKGYTNKAADSIIYTIPVANGEVKGYEIALRESGSHNIKRIRKLLNGNKLYSLVTIQDSSEINNIDNNKFFETFRFNDPKPNDDLFVSKAGILLKDISSADSAVSSLAVDYLNEASFTKKELPLLHNAVLKNYSINELGFDRTKEDLEKIILDINDTSSYNFAKNNYAAADDSTKVILLDIMGAFPTLEHFNDIKLILLNNPPHITPEYDFVDKLTDTLQLTATIFPGIVTLIKDSSMSPVIMQIAAQLLDSNIIDKSLLKLYQPDILKLAEEKYLLAKNNEQGYDASKYSLLRLLGKMNNAECNEILQKWSVMKDDYLQFDAVMLLLQNKQPINPSALKSLAADKATRVDLYDSLKAYKKENLFPAPYLNQKSFAESLIYSAASDDDEPVDINYVSQKVLNFNGKQSRFFFYKVIYGEGDDASSYLACAGPFQLNTTAVSGEATAGLYYDEDFDDSKSADQIDAIITQMENSFKKSSN